MSLYNKPIADQEQAQAIADIVHKHSPAMNDVKPVIEFSYRPTTRRGGTCWYHDGRIVLYPRGQNWGTLAHELAHLNAGYVRGHCARFYEYLEDITRTMEGMAEVL